MKALVIEDETDVRRVACLSLGRVGKMEVVDAAGGAEGLAKAEAERPDVILLDVMMPDMDGPAVFAALQANAATRDIPVIFMTAKVMTSELARLQALGAKGVIAKPFTPATLAGEVRAILAT